MSAMTLIRAGVIVPAGGGGGTSTATFDPANKKAAIVLSNANLTAFGDNVVDDQGVYATGLQTTGKFYFEFDVDAQYSGSDGVAVMIGTNGSNQYNLPNGSACVQWNTKSGNAYSAGSFIGAIGTINPTGRGQVAFDIPNRKAWFRPAGGDWNNDGSANPATNTNGITIPAGTNVYICFYIPGAGQMSAKFNASGWAGSATSGFVEWP